MKRGRLRVAWFALLTGCWLVLSAFSAPRVPGQPVDKVPGKRAPSLPSSPPAPLVLPSARHLAVEGPTSSGDVSVETLSLMNPNAPPTPSLWTSNVSFYGITLNWSMGGGATWSALKRWNGSQWLAVYQGSANSYTDLASPPGDYKVSVWRSNGGWSAWSFNGGYGHTGANMGQQVSMTADATSTAITLTLPPVGSRYLFYKWVNGAWQQVQFDTRLVYTDYAVSANTGYYYSAWVQDIYGGWKATHGNGWINAVMPPAKPLNLTQTNSTSSSVAVAWGAVTGAPLPDPGVYYHVFVDGTAVGSTASTTYTVSGLAAGTQHTVGVLAHNDYWGRSDRSEIAVRTGVATSVTVSAPSQFNVQLPVKVDVSGITPAFVEVYVDNNFLGNATPISSSRWVFNWNPKVWLNYTEQCPDSRRHCVHPSSFGAHAISAIAYSGGSSYGSNQVASTQTAWAGPPVPFSTKYHISTYFDLDRSRNRQTDYTTAKTGWVGELPEGNYNSVDPHAYDQHWGVDIAVGNGNPDGARLQNVADGTVHQMVNDFSYERGTFSPGCGNYIAISHNGPDGLATHYTIHCHAQTGSISQAGMAVGKTVSQGTVLGRVGCTGSCTGDHDHFAIMVGSLASSYAVDPYNEGYMSVHYCDWQQVNPNC